MGTRLVKQILLTGFLLLVFSSFSLISFSQYILNGNATQNTCNCYTLTQPVLNQSGSVWNATKMNLNNAFDFNFNVYLGCLDQDGADGIVFILQPISTSLGASGGGMGFDGINPSVGISLDTWQNFDFNDPAYDHISIQTNGIVQHGSDLVGPVQASASTDNIEDCAWHVFRISWDPATKWLRTYFDGVKRLEVQYDLIANIFNGDPMVYWGFSSATGGAYNLQQFCTALNPMFTTNLTSDATCFSAATSVTFHDQSISFAPIQSWYWDFGDNTTSTLRNPPLHTYTTPGIYQVKLAIKGLDGCTSDTLKKNIAIGSKPLAGFQAFDTCFGKSPRIVDLSTNSVGEVNQWKWILDDSFVSNSQQPSFTNLSEGLHQLKLVVRSIYGCESDTATQTFRTTTQPSVDIVAANGCRNKPINFTGLQLDNNTTITKWNWNFGDGKVSSQQNPIHSYSQVGQMTVKLNATANGCTSVDVTKTIYVAFVDVKTMSDTIALPNTPFKIGNTFSSNTSGVISFAWLPPMGLDNPSTMSPTAILQDDIRYIVTASTIEGCIDTDTLNVEIFKGSAVYVPTAFTPNNDGLNDKLRPSVKGIKRLDYFKVYNRWGHLVFSTSNLHDGWDGKVNSANQQTGTFVWRLRAEDVIGKIYEMKGTTTILK